MSEENKNLDLDFSESENKSEKAKIDSNRVKEGQLVLNKKSESKNIAESYLSNFEKRLGELEALGKLRGRHNKIRSIFGIVISVLACLFVLYFGYKLIPEINKLVDEVDNISKLNEEINNELQKEVADELNEKNNPIIRRRWQRCEVVADCLAVQNSCCACELGGGQAAINKNYLAVWQDEIEDKCEIECSGSDNCKTGTAVCVDGMCNFEPLSCLDVNRKIELVSSTTIDEVACCADLYPTVSADSKFVYCGNCGDGFCEGFETDVECKEDCSLENIIKNTWKDYIDYRFGIAFKYPPEWILSGSSLSPVQTEGQESALKNAPINFYVYSNQSDVFFNDERIIKNPFADFLKNSERIEADSTSTINGYVYDFYKLTNNKKLDGKSLGENYILIREFEHLGKELFFGIEWIEKPDGNIVLGSDKKQFMNIISTINFIDTASSTKNNIL